MSLRRCTLAAGLLLLSLSLCAQRPAEFQQTTDSLQARLTRRTGVTVALSLQKVVRRGAALDFTFSQELADYPWHTGDVEWFRNQLRELLPAPYRAYSVGSVLARKTDLNTLPMPLLQNDGQPFSKALRVPDPRDATVPLVSGSEHWPLGLDGRHIALWQSHGRYYEAQTGRWEWQRAATHGTVEDLYTQSYVLPFLLPMLENAGAVVMLPRERDPQPYEVVCDNDPGFSGPREGLIRRRGTYKESGPWTDAGPGFADNRRAYLLQDQPFGAGTARMAQTVGSNDLHRQATATWSADIPVRGDYAVYVCYRSFANSTTRARYVIRHQGGESVRYVNQQMGGGTWVYLGTFPFSPGDEAWVRLSNRSDAAGVVSADAVRFGGGMGKVEREGCTSGLPAYTEGALYNMPWSGIPSSLFDDWDNDYTKDFAGRGRWVQELSGGSRVRPDAPGRQIPFDLSLAFHSDAGITPNDSIVGTLAIYTLLADGADHFPNGEDRINSRALADLVQTQVVDDIRARYEPRWTRRQTWDRSYSESRTPGVPALLLEILAHQNFSDMRLGLDPSFRFCVSRAVYKGILKYLSNRYGCAYAVQPLPVHGCSALLEDDRVLLSWKPTVDPLEPTATPQRYLVQTRIDDGAFDDGREVTPAQVGDRLQVSAPLQRGHLYSFRIVACNAGGKSFPSEILSVGLPHHAKKKVLIVNNFTRVSAPAWFDTPSYAGFNDRIDSGVPYLNEINATGSVYEYDRTRSWTDDDNPGFGGSYVDRAGTRYAGNRFDYPALHGADLMDEGVAFASQSAEAFGEGAGAGYDAVDLICGKQVTTRIGSGAVSDRFPVFPPALQAALRTFTAGGGHLLVSGAYIGTDVWDRVYPVPTEGKEADQAFVQEVLGYRWVTNFGDHSGYVLPVGFPMDGPITYNRSWSEELYRVENPDGIAPAGPDARTFLQYHGSLIPAGTLYNPGPYRAVAMGFPIESVPQTKVRRALWEVILHFWGW